MVTLELGKLQPLDVLLVSGDEKSSEVIRNCTSLARAGTPAGFSHAGLFLSPGLILESTFSEGVVFSNLVESASTYNPQSDSSRFSARIDAGRLRLFATLDGTNGAVFRHVRYSDPALAPLLSGAAWMFRSSIFEALAAVYLAEYPKIGRLVNVYHELPGRLRRTIAFVSDLLEQRIAPGPFCSELVAIAYGAIRDCLPTLERSPETVAPSDFANSCDFGKDFQRLEGDPSPVLTEPELPGTPCDRDFASDIAKMLTTPALGTQNLQSHLIKVQTLAASLVAEIQGAATEEAKDLLAQENCNIRKRWLTRIEKFINSQCDLFWDWVKSANQCRMACVERRESTGWVVNWPPPTKTFTEQLEELEIPSYKRPRYWQGNACHDIRGCVCNHGGTTWEQLLDQYHYEQESARKRLSDHEANHQQGEPR